MEYYKQRTYYAVNGMNIVIHPHAQDRMRERGAKESEVIATIELGERFPAKFGRTGFRHTFSFNSIWSGKTYQKKQIEVFAVDEADTWIVITIIVKYF
mgnify:CR=1 FL=1